MQYCTEHPNWRLCDLDSIPMSAVWVLTLAEGFPAGTQVWSLAVRT